MSLKLLWDTAQARPRSADAHKSYRLLINATEMFVRSGFLSIVLLEIQPERLQERVGAELYSLLHSLATRTGLYAGIPQNILPNAYAQEITQWLVSLEPTTLVGRIVQAAGELSMWTENLNEPGQSLSAFAPEFLASWKADSEEAHAVLNWAYTRHHWTRAGMPAQVQCRKSHLR